MFLGCIVIEKELGSDWEKHFQDELAASMFLDLVVNCQSVTWNKYPFFFHREFLIFTRLFTLDWGSRDVTLSLWALP